MTRPPLPPDEAGRLQELREYEVLDTLPEQAYDDIVFLASHICGAPIALVSLIDENRQWFKAKRGLSVAETPRELAFCAHAILEPRDMLIVPDATQDVRFSSNALVIEDPKIRFYAGAPLLTSSGHAMGTLCVIDREPRELKDAERKALQTLSRQVVQQLELRRAIAQLEQQFADLREEKGQLGSHLQGLEEINARLQAEAHGDSLTGLPNRMTLDRHLRAEFQRARETDTPLALLLLDIDEFEEFNQSFGRPAGDEVLQKVVTILQEVTRPDDFVARFGREEFAVVLPEADPTEARIIAQQLCDVMHQNDWAHRKTTISIGGACIAPTMASHVALFDAADQELLKAEKRGRDCVYFAPSAESTCQDPA